MKSRVFKILNAVGFSVLLTGVSWVCAETGVPDSPTTAPAPSTPEQAPPKPTQVLPQPTQPEELVPSHLPQPPVPVEEVPKNTGALESSPVPGAEPAAPSPSTAPKSSAPESDTPPERAAKPHSAVRPGKSKRVYKVDKDTEGTSAPNRFQADTVIKSQYKFEGEQLEVDPD